MVLMLAGMIHNTHLTHPLNPPLVRGGKRMRMAGFFLPLRQEGAGGCVGKNFNIYYNLKFRKTFNKGADCLYDC